MLQMSNSDQPAQTASLMRIVILAKLENLSGRRYSHFEQSACMRRSVRVFAVATFQEILIKYLFLTKKKKKKHTCLIKMPY